MKYPPLPLDLLAIGYNMLPVSFTNNVTAAPHAETQRATYTVPQGKRALITAVDLSCTRFSAPTAAGLVKQTLRITPRDKTSIDVLSYSAVPVVAGDDRNITLSYFLPLYPGDNISVVSSDTSTGGLVNINTVATVLEFDY